MKNLHIYQNIIYFQEIKKNTKNYYFFTLKFLTQVLLTFSLLLHSSQFFVHFNLSQNLKILFKYYFYIISFGFYVIIIVKNKSII